MSKEDPQHNGWIKTVPEDLYRARDKLVIILNNIGAKNPKDFKEYPAGDPHGRARAQPEFRWSVKFPEGRLFTYPEGGENDPVVVEGANVDLDLFNAPIDKLSSSLWIRPGADSTIEGAEQAANEIFDSICEERHQEDQKPSPSPMRESEWKEKHGGTTNEWWLWLFREWEGRWRGDGWHIQSKNSDRVKTLEHVLDRSGSRISTVFSEIRNGKFRGKNGKPD